MRQLAKARGEKISEYGVENSETGEVPRLLQKLNFMLILICPSSHLKCREDGTEVEEYQEDLEMISLAGY